MADTKQQPKPAPAPVKPEAKPAPVRPGALAYIEGMDGQVELRADRLKITRKGLFNILAYGFNAQREIPLGAITEVVFKEPGLLNPGYIEFVVAGRSTVETGRINHNAVKFQKQKQAQFEALKEKVFALVEQANRQKA